MDIWSIILLAIGLAMDCLSVAFSQGLCQRGWHRRALLMALLFGLFQGGMPLIGYAFGTMFASFFRRFAPWVALLLLGLIGGKMIVESFQKEEKPQASLWQWRNLLMLSVATSIDALSTGVVFIPYPEVIMTAVIIIAAVSFLFALIGYMAGVMTGGLKVNVMLIGGILLIGIGLKIFIEGIFF